MTVSILHASSPAPIADGVSFGDTGAYVRIDGRLGFAADPLHPANAGIVDLELAPRDADGRVRFEAGFTLVTPADASRGNGCLIFDVPNRGSGLAVRQFNRILITERTVGLIDDPGDGFLYRHGFSFLTVGWQGDVDPTPGALTVQLPVAEGVRGQASVELRPASRGHSLPFTMLGNVPYEPVDRDQPGARLLTREADEGPWEEVPRDRWRIVNRESPLRALQRAIVCDDGFDPAHIYLVTYEAQDPVVAGAGLLALRDAAAWGRSGAGGLVPAFDRVLGFGASQTGRVLRHMLYLGLLRDEDGAIAFDGMHIDIAAGRRGDFNHRFGLPSAVAHGFSQLFPFAFEPSRDPATGRTAGMLDAAKAGGYIPKVVATNTSYEYWHGDASLIHVDPAGERDLPGEPDARCYLLAGAHHTVGNVPLSNENNVMQMSAHYGLSVVDVRPLKRAALMNLDAWVRDGTPPPDSRHPRLADGTAVTRESVLERFSPLPGMEPPEAARFDTVRALDLGPDADRGIGVYPPVEGYAYPALVSAVDDDLNEVAGIRLPDLTVPVGTHTGWNGGDPARGGDPRTPPMFFGLTRYFAPDAARREPGDWRPSIAERYASRDAYLAVVRREAEKLAAERYLLAEDVDLVVANCADRYDDAVRQ